jgi:CubicO group peptidase (beta-lactamase class C family)
MRFDRLARLHWVAVWVAIAGGGLWGSSSAAAASPIAECAAPADTPATTTAGHGFILPRGWTLTQRGSASILEAPEGDTRIALIDVDAKDAGSAIDAAWAIYRGGAKPEVTLSMPVANRDGWRDGRSDFHRAAAGRSLGLRAMRHGAQWAVRIDDLNNAVAGKRSAELRLIRDEFLPRGYARESFAGRRAHRLDAKRLDVLKTFVERSAQTLGVPGTSIGIIERGRTLYAGGFGVRGIGRPEPVDADTLYPIASNTKPLTTLMLAKLVDEQKFDWDTPVTDLLPEFRLADAEITRQLRVKHLLCACTGLPYRNLDWEFAPANAPARIALDILARMRPTSTFGGTYQYSNPIAAAAGLVGGHVAYPKRELGAAYDQATASRVFGPLGMKRTTFDFDRAMRGNYARSHGVAPNGELERVDPARDRQMHAVRATGGAWSNVDDLLAYVRMELAGGTLPDGRRYISETALKARWAAQIPTGRHSWYGMGLDTDMTSGTPVMYHGGRLYGQRSNVVWLPEHDVGLVILMNASTGNVLMDAFPRKLLEVLFDGEAQADSMVEAAAVADREQRAATRRSLRIPADRDHVALLASRYRNDLLGEIRVTRSGEETMFDFGVWKAPVASRGHADGSVEFVVAIPSPPFPFVTGKSGDRRTLTIRDAQNEYVFVEM